MRILRKPANVNETTDTWRLRALEDAVEALEEQGLGDLDAGELEETVEDLEGRVNELEQRLDELVALLRGQLQ